VLINHAKTSRSLRRAGPSSREVLPSVMCLNKSVIVKPRKMGGLGPQEAVEPLKKKIQEKQLHVRAYIRTPEFLFIPHLLRTLSIGQPTLHIRTQLSVKY
jgi:hypothetical protein